jgi:hypothetical protein
LPPGEIALRLPSLVFIPGAQAPPSLFIILPLATAFAIFLNTFRPPCASCGRPQPHKIMDILPAVGFFSITIRRCLSS